MKLEDVKARIEEIRIIGVDKGDDEVAHSREDQLYYDFVVAIIEGKIDQKDLVEIAKELIKSHDIDFARWCA